MGKHGVSTPMKDAGSGGSPSSMGTPVKEGNLMLQYPVLTNSNYPMWVVKMKANMRAQGVWSAIVPTAEGEVEERKDQAALAIIFGAVDDESFIHISAKETAREAWETLRTVYLGDERVKEVKLQTLRFEFEGLWMTESDSVDSFGAKVTNLVSQIRALGDKLEESQVVRRVLRSLREKFAHLAATIEEYGGLEKKKLEQVFGSLKAHEERLRAYAPRQDQQ
ncbi:unnamed protein product, partial [Cuscuta campestris]